MNLRFVFVEWCEIQTHLAAFNRLNAVREVAIWENPTGKNKPKNMTVSLRVAAGCDGVTVQWNKNTKTE